MRSSYSEEDVIILLKDITGLVTPQPAEEREKLIQAGRHYCEMLPVEYVPTLKYMEAYREALKNYGSSTAFSVGRLADQIIEKKGKQVVLVSLARAGIPVGILLKRYIRWKYKVNVMHYSISIIRGKGIDENAVTYILNRHKPENILFVDGWIGKGAIQNELKKAVRKFPGLSEELAVAADPANITGLSGTNADLLIPSSCLNSTVSGLISRTFLRDDIIGKEDFHGAAFYEKLQDEDLSYEFIGEIESRFQKENPRAEGFFKQKGIEKVREIAESLHIEDINLIKPGIGETTRVLLRRVPWKILIDKGSRDDVSLNHIRKLAEEKGVPIEYGLLGNYKACGIIRQMADT